VDIEAVVAHSMGGNVAMFLAGTCPEIVPRLLLIDALGPPAESQVDQPARFGRMLKSMLVSKRFGRFETFDAAVDRMLETNYKLTREAAVQMARYGVGPDPDEPSKWTFMFDPRLRGPTPFRFEEGFWQTVIGRIESPVTLLRAGHGYVPVGEVFDGRVSACSDLRVVEMPDDGHHLHVLRPDAVAAEVLGLLSKRVHALT
jgi:pimeloyl-ACP methyl ester carboxylesterase